jgi:hypothetical protein
MAEPIGLTIDYDGYLDPLEAIGRHALPASAANTLNNAAFAAMRLLSAHAADVFDRPKMFSTKAFMTQTAAQQQPSAADFDAAWEVFKMDASVMLNHAWKCQIVMPKGFYEGYNMRVKLQMEDFASGATTRLPS